MAQLGGWMSKTSIPRMAPHASNETQNVKIATGSWNTIVVREPPPSPVVCTYLIQSGFVLAMPWKFRADIGGTLSRIGSLLVGRYIGNLGEELYNCGVSRR